jgi:hypothetical protein
VTDVKREEHPAGGAIGARPPVSAAFPPGAPTTQPMEGAMSVNTGSARKPVGAAAVGPDASWRDLYRVGGLAAFLATLLYVIALVVTFTVPAAPTEGGAATLEYIATFRSVYILEQVLWLAPSVLLMVVFLALSMAIKHLNKSYAAIGGVLGVAAWALSLVYPATGGGAPALAYLSDRYAAAATDTQRAPFAAAAEVFIAQNTIPTAVGILGTLSLLILSLIMLKGDFRRGAVYLGVVTGAVGTVSEALKPALGLGYALYGLLLFAWFIAIGWELYSLARAGERGQTVGG